MQRYVDTIRAKQRLTGRLPFAAGWDAHGSAVRHLIGGNRL